MTWFSFLFKRKFKGTKPRAFPSTVIFGPGGSPVTGIFWEVPEIMLAQFWRKNRVAIDKNRKIKDLLLTIAAPFP